MLIKKIGYIDYLINFSSRPIFANLKGGGGTSKVGFSPKKIKI